MKDIFEIIENRKDKHIKIKGEISEYTLVYDIDTINDFYSILLDNTDHMDVTTFNVNENNDSVDMSIYDITILARRSTYKSIEFDIDIHVDNYLWRELADFEDFIYYYTEGAVKYDNKHISDSMVDRLEEYMSGRIIEDFEPVRENINSKRDLYDETFFEENALIISSLITRGSGSIKLTLDNLYISKDKVYIVIRTDEPEMGTADIKEATFSFIVKQSDILNVNEVITLG
jgi:hypothetical protein